MAMSLCNALYSAIGLLFIVQHEFVRPVLSALAPELRRTVRARDFAQSATSWRVCDGLIYQHLMGAWDSNADCDSFCDSVGAHAEAMRLINLAKSWLGSFLPHCISKRCCADLGCHIRATGLHLVSMFIARLKLAASS